MDKTNKFSHFEKESSGSIQFNRKIIKMIFPVKICIDFHTQVFHTFSRI